MTISYKGVNEFDIDAGEPTSQTADVNMDMKMNIDAGGQKLAIGMKGEFKAGTTYDAAGAR